MKRSVLILSVLLLSALAFAQTGMFDITFDTAFQAVDKELKAKGFVLVPEDETNAVYTHPQKPDLKELAIRYTGDANLISGWTIQWDTTKSSQDALLEELKKLHGEPDVEEDFDYDYIWYLENDKALYVDVYTSEEMKMVYTEGNYDDDYYWYYEDYWDW